VALPSLFESTSVGCDARVSLSVALRRVGSSGSPAVAVFTSGSVVMWAANATGTLNVRLLPAPAASVAPVRPAEEPPALPLTDPHVAVPTATQVAFADSVTPAGSESPTVTACASDGPLLVTVTT
jgi:hypothetical protein